MDITCTRCGGKSFWHRCIRCDVNPVTLEQTIADLRASLAEKENELINLRVDLAGYKKDCEQFAGFERLSATLADKLVDSQRECERLREALVSLLAGHFSLYKVVFGENSNPDDDCVRRQAKQALTGKE